MKNTASCIKRGDVYLCAYVAPELRDGLDELARQNERSRSAELRQALAEYLRRQNRLQVHPI